MMATETAASASASQGAARWAMSETSSVGATLKARKSAPVAMRKSWLA